MCSIRGDFCCCVCFFRCACNREKEGDCHNGKGSALECVGVAAKSAIKMYCLKGNPGHVQDVQVSRKYVFVVPVPVSFPGKKCARRWRSDLLQLCVPIRFGETIVPCRVCAKGVW